MAEGLKNSASNPCYASGGLQRAFVAIALPDEACRELCQQCRQLLEPSLSGLRLSAPDNLHLTLLFLGDTPAEKLHRLADVLQQRLAGFQAFELLVEATGGFPADKSRLVVAHIRDDDALLSLHDRVAAAVDDLSLDYDRRPFRPHITLARSNKPLLSVCQPVNMHIPASNCVIYTSRLTHKGSVYRRFSTLAFA